MGLQKKSLIAYAKSFLDLPRKKQQQLCGSCKLDCSSFVQSVYQKHGICLPRKARNQARQGAKVPKDRISKGDLLFFYVEGKYQTNKIAGHVGIYIGQKQMIHCLPYPQKGVHITSIEKPHWIQKYLFSRRILMKSK